MTKITHVGGPRAGQIREYGSGVREIDCKAEAAARRMTGVYRVQYRLVSSEDIGIAVWIGTPRAPAFFASDLLRDLRRALTQDR